LNDWQKACWGMGKQSFTKGGIAEQHSLRLKRKGGEGGSPPCLEGTDQLSLNDWKERRGVKLLGGGEGEGLEIGPKRERGGRGSASPFHYFSSRKKRADLIAFGEKRGFAGFCGRGRDRIQFDELVPEKERGGKKGKKGVRWHSIRSQKKGRGDLSPKAIRTIGGKRYNLGEGKESIGKLQSAYHGEKREGEGGGGWGREHLAKGKRCYIGKNL